jgi:hypothetical protein
MSNFSKLKYWYNKVPEMKAYLEPLNQLMIRTSKESKNYMRHHHSTTIKTVNSKDINLLHAIENEPAIKKLLERAHFLKTHMEEIKMLEKKNGFVDLTSTFFLNSPFASIDSEIIAEVVNKKYITLSGVGRIGAIKIVFPEGLRIKITVAKLDGCLKKRLIAVNNIFIYSNRFSNLKKYGINEKEIIDSKRILTKKCSRRGKFLKNLSRKMIYNIVPFK